MQLSKHSYSICNFTWLLQILTSELNSWFIKLLLRTYFGRWIFIDIIHRDFVLKSFFYTLFFENGSPTYSWKSKILLTLHIKMDNRNCLKYCLVQQTTSTISSSRKDEPISRGLLVTLQSLNLYKPNFWWG